MPDLEVLGSIGLKEKAIREGWGPKSIAYMADSQRQMMVRALEIQKRVWLGKITQEEAREEFKRFRPSLGQPPSSPSE